MIQLAGAVKSGRQEPLDTSSIVGCQVHELDADADSVRDVEDPRPHLDRHRVAVAELELELKDRISRKRGDGLDEHPSDAEIGGAARPVAHHFDLVAEKRPLAVSPIVAHGSNRLSRLAFEIEVTLTDA